MTELFVSVLQNFCSEGISENFQANTFAVSFLVEIQPAFTCPKLKIETLEQGVMFVRVFIVDFEHISHRVVLVSLLLTLNIFHTLFTVSIVNFEHVIVGWERITSSVFSSEFSNIFLVTIFKDLAFWLCLLFSFIVNTGSYLIYLLHF